MGGERQLLVLCVLLLFSTSLVFAIGLGVNKGTISYEDVLQNGYAQEIVLVTTDSTDTITGTYQFEGSIAPWIRVEPADESFEFSRDRPHQVKIIVEPPGDARLDEYSGGVRILTGEISRTEGGKIGTSTRAAFLIKVALGLTGTERIECQVGGVNIVETEIGQPFDFHASVVNKGNVRIKPEFTIKVHDQYQEREVASFIIPMDEEILPTVTEQFMSQVFHELPAGQYWATVTATPCDGGGFFTFDILEPGGIADNGELLRVEAPVWAETGEILPIKAIFRNTGSRTVNAKFQGTITTREGGRLVKTIDTDRYNVAPGATAEIETFFNPVDPAQYIVAGRVLYNNKLTFQKSTVINVQGVSLFAGQTFGGPLLLILLLVIAILVFLILIARKKRRQRHARW